MSFSLQFVKLPVRDLDAMADFYVRALGLEQRDRIATPDFEEVLLGTAGEAQSLILIRYKAAQATGKPGCTLGYYTKGIEAARAHVVASGGTAKGPILDLAPMPVKVCLVDDPEGNEIELVERVGAA